MEGSVYLFDFLCSFIIGLTSSHNGQALIDGLTTVQQFQPSVCIVGLAIRKEKDFKSLKHIFVKMFRINCSTFFLFN